MKVCVTCSVSKPLTDFHKKSVRKDGRQSICRYCTSQYYKQYYKASVGSLKARKQSWSWTPKKREQRFFKKYGFSYEERNAMLEAQGGCAVCGKGEPTELGWVVDHSHNTGRIRGILCSNCNTAIGLFYDDVETLENAIRYLDE